MNIRSRVGAVLVAVTLLGGGWVGPVTASATAAGSSCPTNSLTLGQKLTENGACDRLISAHGHFELDVLPMLMVINQWFTPTGVRAGYLSATTGPSWQQSTDGFASYTGLGLMLRSNSNLVLITPAGAVKWSSGTAGSGAVRAVLSDNGHLVLLNASGQQVWSSDGGLYVLGGGDQLRAGSHLVSVRHNASSETWTNSNSQRSVGTMQTDGNFVFACGYPLRTVWQTNTHVPGSYMSMLSDGRLIVKVPGGRIVWSTPTRGIKDAFTALGTRVIGSNGVAWRAYDWPNGKFCG